MPARTQDELYRTVAEAAQRTLPDYQALYQGLTLEQLNWKPDAKRWSIGQVLDHLYLQEKIYPPRILAACQTVGPRPAGATFRSGLLGGYLTRLVAPGGKPVPTVKPLEPRASQYDWAIVEKWERLQADFLRALEAAADRDLRPACIPWAVTKLVRFRLGDILLLEVAHKQRHLEQIVRLKQQMGAL